MALIIDKKIGDPIAWGENGKAEFIHSYPNDRSVLVKVTERLSGGDSISVRKEDGKEVLIKVKPDRIRANAASFAVTTNPPKLEIRKKPNFDKPKKFASAVHGKLRALQNHLFHPKNPNSAKFQDLKEPIEQMIKQIGIIIASIIERT